MRNAKTLLALIFTALVLTAPNRSKGQDQPGPDALFQKARAAAFGQKNYPHAIMLCREALQKSPGYTDIKVFLGRLLYWNDQPDSALVTLDDALEMDPGHEDGAVAAASIAYFTDHFDQSLGYCNRGLQYHPHSHELLLQKAKSLVALESYREALRITDSLLDFKPAFKEARMLADRIKDRRAKNKIGISYDVIHFNKQFDQSWHLVSLDYSRQTKLGSVIGRVNYGNRFGKPGVQFELDAYPKIARRFYAYLNLGYSPDLPIFPTFRSGFSLYANLPKSFEADAGFRYLQFNEKTWIYTGSLGKYYKNWWFNLRAYITPADERISQSYGFSARYYTGGADDYLSFSIGSGLSPDDRNQAVQLNSNYKLLSQRASLGYNFSWRKLNLFSVNAGISNVEYLPKTKGQQFTAGIGYQRRF